MKIHTQLHVALLSLALAACSGGAEPEPTNDGPAMPESVWSQAPLEGAVDVIDLRESAKSGDEVVVRGTLQDFGSFANFSLVEDTLDHCAEMPEPDHCATPWDYCCEDQDKLRELTVSVEFQGEDGDVADWSLEGAHGLDRLDEVVAMGTLEIDEAGNMRLLATRMSRQ